MMTLILRYYTSIFINVKYPTSSPITTSCVPRLSHYLVRDREFNNNTSKKYDVSKTFEKLSFKITATFCNFCCFLALKVHFSIKHSVAIIVMIMVIINIGSGLSKLISLGLSFGLSLKLKVKVIFDLSVPWMYFAHLAN